jgi:hypothetical protein
VTATSAYVKKVEDTPDIVPVVWDVAQGKDIKIRGVFPSWETCRQHINLVFDYCKMEHEVWWFVFDNMEVNSNPKSDRVSILWGDPPIFPPPKTCGVLL